MKAVVTLTRTETYVIQDDEVVTADDAELAARVLWSMEHNPPTLVDITVDDRIDESPQRRDN